MSTRPRWDGEELDQGLNLAEASTRWFREPDQTLENVGGG